MIIILQLWAGCGVWVFIERYIGKKRKHVIPVSYYVFREELFSSWVTKGNWRWHRPNNENTAITTFSRKKGRKRQKSLWYKIIITTLTHRGLNTKMLILYCGTWGMSSLTKQTNKIKWLSSICTAASTRLHVTFVLTELTQHTARSSWQTRVLYDIWSRAKISRLTSTTLV